MAIQGLQTTDSFADTGSVVIGDATYPDLVPGTERPTNWRQGILMRFPNGHAPLVALTSVMKKKTTDDPQFHWWEREMADRRLALDGDHTAVTQTLTLLPDPFGFQGGNNVKIGDILWSEFSSGGHELMRVTGYTSNTEITVERDYTGSLGAGLVYTAATDNMGLIIIGSVYDEGADTPQSVRYRPTKQFNYTQIFRDSLKATRTAMHTRLRTVDEIRDAKQQALLYHSIGMEYGFLFGKKFETGGTTGPQRMTGGVIEFIEAAGNSAAWDPGVAANDAANMAQLEDQLLEAFRFGSQEKMAFLGNRAMLTLQRIARASSSLEITPSIKEYGMDVRRVFTPFGTLVCKTHPLFNQINAISDASALNTATLDSYFLILDMANISYRPLRNSDTQYLPDRQNNGADAITSEFLTEAGLEVNHGTTHYLLTEFNTAKGEDFGSAGGVVTP